MKIFSATKIKYNFLYTRFYTFLKARFYPALLFGCSAVRLFGCSAVRLFGCSADNVVIIVSIGCRWLYCFYWKYNREIATAETDFILFYLLDKIK